MLQIDFSSLFGKNSIDKPLKERLNQLLDLPIPGRLSRFVQTTAAYFYARLGESVRWYFSSKVKSRKKIPIKFLVDISPSEELTHIAHHIKNNSYLKDSNGAFLMTHDVDYLTCYKNIIWIAELEYRKGIKASYNFLVKAGYRIDPQLLKTLQQMGHEIGLHGYTYDLRLAYRRKSTILKTLKVAKQKLEDILGNKISGFRNHSLLLSHDMLEVLVQLEFLYDSGIFPKFHFDGFSTYYCFPFKYKNTNLFEIPVIYPQDTELFRSTNADDTEGLDFFIEKIKFIRKLNGVVCLNHHPTIIAAHKTYYEQLLSFVQSEQILNETPDFGS